MTPTAIIRAMRSEGVRLRGMWKLPAAAVALAVVATIFEFSGSGGPSRAGSGSGAATTDALSGLAQPDGIVAGIATSGTLAGLIALVVWALSVARDLQTGTIRVLLVTQASRATYLGGKLLALAATTVATSLLIVGAGVATAYVGAAANDVSTELWQFGDVAHALLDVSLAMLAWGALGAVLATLTRSSAGAIAGGIGYLLLGENLLGAVWSSASEWLPGGSIDNVLEGGSEDVAYARSALLVLGYLAVATVVSLVIATRRDVTD